MRCINGQGRPGRAYFAPMARRRRIASAFFAVIALVFAQFAVSAHACPFQGEPAKPKMSAHHVCCDEEQSPQPSPVTGNVCESHCQYGHATFDNAQPVPAAADSTGPGLRVALPVEATFADARPAWRFVPAAAPPPPAILFGVLRI